MPFKIEMNNIKIHLHNLLDSGEYVEAREIVNQILQETTSLEKNEKLNIETHFFGFLIDIGCESENEDDLIKAINFFETNEVILESVITKSSYYYNLANAKHALGKIFYLKNRGVHSLYLTKDKLQAPINLYWLAFKTLNTNDKSLFYQILINLSNSLVQISRIIEGLQFLDIVLKQNPNFPQALISRGDNLFYLSEFTNCPVTIALYTQIFNSYDKGIKTNLLPNAIADRVESHKLRALLKIQAYGFDNSNINKDLIETKNEYNNHTEFRKFCIDNFLTLNEHGIYCPCVANKKDNLQIGIPNVYFKSELLPKLELLLNRIKSEFAFARWNFYKSNTEEAFDYDVVFSELLENEVINSQTETLRTSYRICYGILDKIALGICKLYDVEGGNIFFERFWNDKKRIATLETQRNIHLNALYSIANDLNTETGELKHFKNWRNKLEHNLLILKDTKNQTPDLLNIFDDENFVIIVDLEEFKEKTQQLLQITRAAIFSFVFCVRLETITTNKVNENKNSYNISQKK